MAKTWILADFRRALEARDRWFSDLAIYSFHSYPPFSISACCRGYWRLFEASISLHFSSMFMNKSQTFASARISFSIWLHESHIIFIAFTVREIAVWWWQGGTELQLRDERRVEKAELYLGFEMPKNWSFRWCWNYGCQIEMCPIEDPSSLWPGPLTFHRVPLPFTDVKNYQQYFPIGNNCCGVHSTLSENFLLRICNQFAEQLIKPTSIKLSVSCSLLVFISITAFCHIILRLNISKHWISK